MKTAALCVAAKMAFIAWLAMLHPAASGADEVLVGGQAWEEVDRKVLANGDILLQLKRKGPAPATAAAANAPAAAPPDAPAVMAAADAAPADSRYRDAALKLIPSLDKDFAAALAKEAQPTDSPGLTALGVTAGDFNQPVTPKDLAAFVARGTDLSGKVKEGVAVQFSPVNLFFPGVLVGGRRYEDSFWMQLAARTQLELATSKSDDERIGQQVAASVTLGLVDGADPRLFWAPLDDCARRAMKAGGLPPRPEPMMTPEELKAWKDSQARAVAAAKDCYAAYREANDKLAAMWARPRWYAGYAKGWQTGESGRLRDGRGGPEMFWTSFSYGLYKAESGVKTLFQLAASRRTGLQVKDPKDDTRLANEDRTDLSLRLKFARDRWSVFTDAGLARVNTAGVMSEGVRRYGYGAEFRLSDTLWLVLGSVTERGFVGGDKRTLLNTGLRFGQSDKPLFGQPGN